MSVDNLQANDFLQYGVPNGAQFVPLDARMKSAIGTEVGYKVHPQDMLFMYMNGGPDPTYIAVVRRLGEDGAATKVVTGRYHSSDPVEGAKLAFGEVFGNESGAPMLSDPENVFDSASLDEVVEAIDSKTTPNTRNPYPRTADLRQMILTGVLSNARYFRGYGHGV